MARCALIVDDDVIHAQMLVEFLQEAGWKACAATGVHEALARLRGHPSLVVSDVRMGDGDGFDLLRAIRASGDAVPVVLMSSFGGRATIDRALASGAYAYLRKPFSLDDLLSIAERAHAGSPGG